LRPLDGLTVSSFTTQMMMGKDKIHIAGTTVKMADAATGVKYNGASHAPKAANKMLAPTDSDQKVSDLISAAVLRQAGPNLLSPGPLDTVTGVAC